MLGTALAAAAIYACSGALGFGVAEIPLSGCIGGIFGLLVAIGALYGDVEFLMFFTIGIKARYLVAIYALIAIAMLFGAAADVRLCPVGWSLGGPSFLRMAPRRGVSFGLSEKWYGLRNRYYRWKRRRASRKFEVYMRSQGRNIHIDGYGRPIDKDRRQKALELSDSCTLQASCRAPSSKMPLNHVPGNLL